jgi:hypothetical protein
VASAAPALPRVERKALSKRKQFKQVEIIDKMCKTCDHEETYHKGGGLLRRLGCMVTGCRCRVFVFGRNRRTVSQVLVDE